MSQSDIKHKRLFIFAGGGTGGHLFPGLAIAEELRTLLGDRAAFLFLCSDRPIDSRILTEAKVRFEPIPAKPLALRPLGMLRFLRGWAPSIRRGRDIIQNAREKAESVHVVAMGGFVAAPIAQAARVEKCPTTLVNLDAVPGKANRWIARRVTDAFTAAPVSEAFAAKWVAVPPIVRAAARVTCSPQEARTKLGLDPARPVLMITGASQGSISINQFLLAFVREHASKLAGWQILHQTGQDDNAPMIDAYAKANIPAKVEKFVNTMGLWWRAADLAISRAGAGSVAEAWASTVPTIFLPYPFHKDQHQKINAKVLVEAASAIVLDDLISPERNLPALTPALSDLLANSAKRRQMAQALAKLGPVDGAAKIATALARK